MCAPELSAGITERNIGQSRHFVPGPVVRSTEFRPKWAIVDLASELQKIYDSEINVRISWLWDGGIDIRLGDEMNGFLAERERRVGS